MISASTLRNFFKKRANYTESKQVEGNKTRAEISRIEKINKNKSYFLEKISKFDKLLNSLIKNTEFKNKKTRDILQILGVLFYTVISIGLMNV